MGHLSDSPKWSYTPTICAVVLEDGVLLKYHLGLKPTIDGILAFAGSTTLEGPLWAVFSARNGAPVVFVRLLMMYVIRKFMLAPNYWHRSLTLGWKSVPRWASSEFTYQGESLLFFDIEYLCKGFGLVSFLGREWRLQAALIFSSSDVSNR